MVNKFLKFNISDNSNAAGILASGPQLVNADDIQSVVYTVGTGIIAITLKGAVGIQARLQFQQLLLDLKVQTKLYMLQ